MRVSSKADLIENFWFRNSCGPYRICSPLNYLKTMKNFGSKMAQNGLKMSMDQGRKPQKRGDLDVAIS